MRLLAERHALGTPQIAGIIAALSARQRWRVNVLSAAALLDGRPREAVGYAPNIARAKRIAAGERALDVLSGDKTLAFWANLYGSRRAVTVDSWMAKAATGHEARKIEQPKGVRYHRIVRAVCAAADQVGETPREFQAAVWLAIRPPLEHRKDKIALEAI